MSYCYFDGALVEESKAHISIHNLGLQRGFGIFDLFRARNGKPVFMDDHLDRFEKSQEILGLSRKISREEVADAVMGLQEWNNYQESTFRLMLLADGSEFERELEPLFYITNVDISRHQNPKMAGVVLHEYVREYPEIKSINYFTSNMLHRKKMAASAIDAVYHWEGKISEASRSNIFIIKDGTLLTPGSHILKGVTRKQILQFSNEITDTQIKDFSVEDLRTADEAFLSSTLKEILPIVEVDKKKVGNGQVGPVTAKIQARFLDHLHS